MKSVILMSERGIENHHFRIAVTPPLSLCRGRSASTTEVYLPFAGMFYLHHRRGAGVIPAVLSSGLEFLKSLWGLGTKEE